MSLGLSDKGYTEKRIFDRLSHDMRIDTRNLFVDIRNGHPRLYGSVQSEAARQAAEEDVMDLPGVGEIEDELLVQPRPSSLVSRDEAIRATLECLLELDPGIKAPHIVVEVVDHNVLVSGQVESYTQKSKVEEIARHIPGAAAVINQLDVPLTSFPLR